MTKKLLFIIVFMTVSFRFAQKSSFWQKQRVSDRSRAMPNKINLTKTQVLSLNTDALKQALATAPVRGTFAGNSNLIISFPNAEGQMERYRIMEASVMAPELEANYPEIKSYAGQGVDDPSARIRFSVSPLGLQSMSLSANKSATFIEPLTQDLTQYTVYKRADKMATFNNFECSVKSKIDHSIDTNNMTMRNADDGVLRTYRLAMSG